MKSRVNWKIWKWRTRDEISQDYEIQIQIVHNVKNDKMKLMIFVRDCDNDADLPITGVWKNVYTDRWMLSFVGGCSRSEQLEHQCLVPYVHGTGRWVSCFSLGGKPDSSSSMAFVELMYRGETYCQGCCSWMWCAMYWVCFHESSGAVRSRRDLFEI